MSSLDDMKFKYKILEFSQNQGRGPDRKPRRPRSDRGRKRGSRSGRREEIKERAGQAARVGLTGAGYVGSLAAGDKIFTGANEAASRVGRGVTSRLNIGSKIPPARPGSARGRLGTAAKYAAGLAIGDLAVRGASKAVGRTIENRHRLAERAKQVRKRRK